MPLKKTKDIKYKFHNVEIEIKNGTIDFKSLVNIFLTETKIKEGYISVLVNIKQINDQYFSVGGRFPLQVESNKSISDYIEYLYLKHLSLENRYRVIQPITIFFNYTSINENTYKYTHSLITGKNKAMEQSNIINFQNEIPANLPLNTDYTTWGNVERLGSNILKIKEYLSESADSNLDRIIQVQSVSRYNRSIEIYTSSNILLNKVSDQFLNPFGTEFTRQIGNKIYHIKNNTVFFIYENIHLDYQSITKARLSKKYIMNMLTLDIETYKNEDKTMSVYCVSIYDGKTPLSYYITDFNSINELMDALLKKLFSREYAQKTIYIHNSSNFDLIFLLKYIVNKKGILLEPIIKEGKFINLRVKYGPNFIYTINFKDSYLLLPDSLDNLTKNFKVETLKGAFPHDFVNKTTLNYIGDIPQFDYFNGTNLSFEEYKQNVTQNWNLKEAAVKYCEGDCIALYQTIMNFSELIYKEFNINISSISTLPGLAFKIFRANYLPKNIKLPVISGKVYSDISEGYYGGHCDLYIPSNTEGNLVYEYDCNSMYPFVMQEFKYPGKILGYFRGNISSMADYLKLYHENLSFIKVKVTAPENLEHPILPNRSENVAIYGVGTWTGWYYSEEIKTAEKYGYQFEILEGYIFEPVTLFIEYVNKIFQMKLTSEPNTPIYTISKLLLNTLYGRFGLTPNLLTHEIVKNKKINEKVSELGLENVQNIITFDDNSIISYNKSFPKLPLINIAIAAAISANARVHMAKFKNRPDFTLLYTDTDSYFTLDPLPAHLIDNKKIGHFKLVHIFKDFVALAPKVYGGLDNEGNEIIKTKGLKTKINFLDLKSLLNEKTISDANNKGLLSQIKWYSNLETGTIVEKDIKYNLKPTNNKRNLIYKNGVFVKTSNKIFKENKMT